MISSREKNTEETSTESGRFRMTGMHVLRLAVLAAGLFVASVAVGQSGSVSAAADNDGVMFGAYAQPRGGESAISAVQNLENKLGDQLPIVRGFTRWDSNLDNRFNNWVVDGDRTLMLSIKPKRGNGQEVSWREIANASPGSRVHNEMVELARDVKRLDGDVWIAFHHEPEAKDRQSYGNNTDFKAAWRKIHTVFAQQGADAEWVWTMTSWSFEVNTGDRRSAGKWYPGDAYVDYLGADPYNWNKCRGNTKETWTSLERVITPFIEFAEQHPTKQLVLPEFGSDEGSRGQKADWLDDAASFLKRPENARKFAAVIYFHDQHEDAAACTWWLDSSSDTLDASRRIARDPFFDHNGDGAPAPAPTTTTTTAAPVTTTTTTAPQVTTTTIAPAPPAVPVKPGVVANTPQKGGCGVDEMEGSDRITWTPQGDNFSYNVRRNGKWLAKTDNTWHWNNNVTSGEYIVIGRDSGKVVVMECRRR